MKLRNRTHVPSSSAPLTLVARMRASAWSSVVIKVGAVVVALLVLGWIGRTAAARPGAAVDDGTREAGVPSMSAVEQLEAGAAPLAIAAIATPTPPPPVAAAAPHGHASETEPVFLNHASVDELRRLPGVGPKRAEAILALRQKLGRFQRIEDLLRVKGIGRSAVKKWRPLVRLDAPTADAGAS